MRSSLREYPFVYALAFVALIAGTAPVFAQLDVDHEHDGKVVLFGNLHAHSNLSKDIKPFDASLSPKKAFQYAKDHGLNFLAISDHHKAADSPHPLRLSANDFAKKLVEVAHDFNAANPGFVAIPAIYFVVTEQNGKDNPLGDGDDTQINATGKEGTDGKRDDLNDSAWTSPIWFVKE